MPNFQKNNITKEVKERITSMGAGGSILVRSGEGVCGIVCMDAARLHQYSGKWARVDCTPVLRLLPSAAVFRLEINFAGVQSQHFAAYNEPGEPLGLMYMARLARMESLQFHIYDPGAKYHYTKSTLLGAGYRRAVLVMARDAQCHNARIETGFYDYNQALMDTKADYESI